MVKGTRFYVAGAMVAVAVGVAFGLYYQHLYQPYYEARTIGTGVKGFPELQERFESLAHEKGGVYAFEVMKRAPLPPDTDLHLLGHAVGDIMYTQTGIAGIAHCTQDFRNACSHTMVIGALSEYGEGALDQIRDACHQAPGGPGAYTMCYHGLGHGVFAYYGYDLGPTVSLCNKTGTPEYGDREAIECIGGAVMELAGGGGHDRDLWMSARETYLTDPLMPCLSSAIPEKAKAQCLIYVTPEIWQSVGINLGRPDPILFKPAFAVCDRIPTSQPILRSACFAGFGKELLPLAAARDIQNIDRMPDEVYARAQSWCLEAGAKDGQIDCLKEALNSLFWGGENDPDASIRFCALLKDREDLFVACEERLADNMRQYILDEVARQPLCEKLDPIHYDLCMATR